MFVRSPRRFALLALVVIGAPSAAAQVRAGVPAADPIDAREHRFLTGLRQLTTTGERSGEAYFSPDGARVIFQSVRGDCPHYQIFTLALAQPRAEPVRVSPGQGKTTCSFFHPLEPRILFASTHLDLTTHPPLVADQTPRRGYSWDMDAAMDIFTADPDGKNLTRVTDAEGYDAEAAWSPDGTSIVFTSTASGDPEIWVMASDGTNRKQLTTAPGYDGGPFFSPDGKSIVFRSFRASDGTCQVFTIGVDGTGETQLTTSPAINWCPFWHPSGKYILYSGNIGKAHNFELFLMRADGTGITRLTYSAGADVLPTFSPDGAKVMWTSTRADGRSQLFIADFWMPADAELGTPTETLVSEAIDQAVYQARFPSPGRH